MPYAQIGFEPIRKEYCGPTAIAAVTGCDLDSVRSAIYRHRRDIRDVQRDGSDKPIAGMLPEEINSVIEALGWRGSNHTIYPFGRASLKSFVSNFRDQGPFIVGVQEHVVAISHGEFCDTNTVVPIRLTLALRRPEVRDYRVDYLTRYERIKNTKRRKAINVEREAA